MSDCNATSIGETPSTYERSLGWNDSGVAAAEDIVAVEGKIGVICIGMSTLNSIAGRLVSKYHEDAERHSSVTLVNGGISGKVSRFWSDPDDNCWTTLADRIAAAGLTTAQIQMVWVMMTNSYPATYGVMTQAQLLAIFSNLKSKYAALQVGWMSSHPYTGYSTDDRVPEPTAYDDSLLMAGNVGHGSMPFWVDFYDVWCDGTTANARTSKVGTAESSYAAFGWLCEDVSTDGVHPGSSGRTKIQRSIQERWRIDPVAVAFWEGGGEPSVPPPPPRRGLIVGGGS